MSWSVFSEPSNRGGKAPAPSNSIAIGHDKAGGASKRLTVAFRIGAEVVSTMRWQPGDKVVIVKDGDIFGIKRVPSKALSSGWMLSKGSALSSLRFRIMDDELVSLLQPQLIVNPIIDGDVVVLCEARKK